MQEQQKRWRTERGLEIFVWLSLNVSRRGDIAKALCYYYSGEHSCSTHASLQSGYRRTLVMVVLYSCDAPPRAQRNPSSLRKTEVLRRVREYIVNNEPGGDRGRMQHTRIYSLIDVHDIRQAAAEAVHNGEYPQLTSMSGSSRWHQYRMASLPPSLPRANV